MKIYINVLILLFPFLFACSLSSNKKISDDTIMAQNIENRDSLFTSLSKNDEAIIFTQIDTIPFYWEGSTYSEFSDSIYMKEIKISTQDSIKIFTYHYTPSDYTMNHEEYIKIGSISISIDSLLKKKHNKIIEKKPYIYWENISFFKMKEHHYILVEGKSRNIYTHEGIKSYLLFDFVENQFQNVWLLYNGYFEKTVFNDFDGDGNLDYLNWGLNMTNISLYHFYKDLVKDTKFYLIIKPSKDQSDDKECNKLDWYREIDKNKSIWFK